MTNILQLPAPPGANPQPVVTAEPPYEIFDRYAAAVIGCFAHHYDTVEVHGVRNHATGTDNGTCYEVDNITPTSFSVYTRLKDGGLDCVGDFSKSEDAVRYGAEVGALYGWPVRNHVLAHHRTPSLAQLQ